jgi:hypothetical protein
MKALRHRLRRAKLHLNHFDVKSKKFLATNPYRISPPKLNRQGTHYLYKAQVVRNAPPSLGLDAGDFVGNLASLLDNLIWYFAPARARNRTDLNFFLCRSLPEFKKNIVPRLAGFDQRVIDAIERHQPYHRAEPFNKDRLILLRHLWNDGKHHVPTIVASGTYVGGPAQVWLGDIPPPRFQPFFGPFDAGKVIGRISVDARPQDYENPHLVFGVALETARPRLRIPGHALTGMYGIVAKKVLPDFARLV